jgi:hypothetical protein
LNPFKQFVGAKITDYGLTGDWRIGELTDWRITTLMNGPIDKMEKKDEKWTVNLCLEITGR